MLRLLVNDILHDIDRVAEMDAESLPDSDSEAVMLTDTDIDGDALGNCVSVGLIELLSDVDAEYDVLVVKLDEPVLVFD